MALGSPLPAAWAQDHGHPHTTPQAESKPQEHIFWTEPARLEGVSRAQDVAFLATGRNVISPTEVTWVLDGSTNDAVVAAAKPILDTAHAGDFLGRQGAGLLRQPVAIHVTARGRYVLERDGRMVVLRSGDAPADTFRLVSAADALQDLYVSLAGLVYVLGRDAVRVYADPPTGAPLWSFDLDAALVPAVSIAVSAKGEVFVAGGGSDVLGVYDVDATGRYSRRRGLRARTAAIQEVGGMALVPMLLLPVGTREGWFEEDRFVFLSDRAGGRIVALAAANLEVIGDFDVRRLVDAARPGRIDVSNRGQIAFVDTGSGAAHTLPGPVVAQLVEKVKVRWRSVVIGDSTHAAPGSGGATAPRDSAP